MAVLNETIAVQDNGPKMLLALWVLGGLSGTFLVLRIYCKRRRHRRLWWDDYILLISWICCLIDVILTSVAVSLGFGKHAFVLIQSSPAVFATIGRVTTTGAFFSILAVVWSKTSFAMTVMRLTMGKIRIFLWFAIVSMNILMILAAIFLFVQCLPAEKNWNPALLGSCWPEQVNVIYGQISSGYSGVIDITLVLLSWNLIWGLRMKVGEKIGIALAMSMGTFAGVAAFIKCHYLGDLSEMDFTYNGIYLVIWTEAEPAVTIMAASVPVLRMLVYDAPSSYFRSKGFDGRQETTIGGLQASEVVSQNAQHVSDRMDYRSNRSTLSSHREGSNSLELVDMNESERRSERS